MIRNWVLEIAFGWLTSYMDACGFILYKGPKAPANDPNIGLAALAQANLGKEYLDLSKQYRAEDKPNNDRVNALAIQVQEGFIKDSAMNREDSADYRNYNQSVFRPLEKSIVNNANQYDTAGRRESEAARGLADVTQGFDTVRQTSLRNNERTGVNPNSGNAQALNAEMNVQEAIAGADAMNKGRKQAENQGNAMQMDAASLGRNLPSNQLASLQAAGQAATGGLNAELANSANNRAGFGVVGGGYKTAMDGYNNQANILQNQYNSRLSAYQAQKSGGGGLGGLGSVLGAGISVFGPKLKDGGEVEEANEPKHATTFSGTGEVEGVGTKTSDSILAKLSTEEFVLNAGTQKMSKTQIVTAAKKAKSNDGLAVLVAINKAGLQYRGAN